MKIVADTHTHTKFSIDGRDDMADMCRSAISKGLSHICFTDHIDNNPADDGCGYFNYDKYSEAIDRVRDEFGDRIQIIKGIEFSEPHVYPKEYEKILNKDFDVIIVGIHYIGKVGLHHFDPKYADIRINTKDYTKQRVCSEYYEEVLQAVRLGGFDILAHFDNPKRYLKEPCREEELVNKIMHELVNKGIALEINTSPFRKGYNDFSPDSGILKRYIDAGGTKVTVGSDAHCSRDIAADFDNAYNMVNEHQGIIGIFKGRRFIPVNLL